MRLCPPYALRCNIRAKQSIVQQKKVWIAWSLRSLQRRAVSLFCRPALPQMIRQRQRYAVAQRGFRQSVRRVEQDAAVAAKAQLRVQLPKRLDQIGLAVEINRNLLGVRLHLIDPDGAAAPCFRGE